MTDTPPADLPPPAEDAAAVLARLAPDALYAAEQDMWVREQPDGSLLVGATHWVAEHGQFMLFTPRQPGAPAAALLADLTGDGGRGGGGGAAKWRGYSAIGEDAGYGLSP
jgi:hypothetical protein